MEQPARDNSAAAVLCVADCMHDPFADSDSLQDPPMHTLLMASDPIVQIARGTATGAAAMHFPPQAAQRLVELGPCICPIRPSGDIDIDRLVLNARYHSSDARDEPKLMQHAAASSQFPGLKRPCPSEHTSGPTLRAISKKQRHLLDEPLRVAHGRKPELGGNDHIVHSIDGRNAISIDCYAEIILVPISVAPLSAVIASSRTAIAISESGLALGDTSKKQRHLPGDPPKAGLCRDHRPGEHNHLDIDCNYGRDASIPVRTGTNTSHHYLASPGKSRTEFHMQPSDLTREEIVHNSSPSPAEANLCTPPPTSLSHRHSLRCIHGDHRCAQIGWTISEYCEACHG